MSVDFGYPIFTSKKYNSVNYVTLAGEDGFCLDINSDSTVVQISHSILITLMETNTSSNSITIKQRKLRFTT